MASYLLLRNNKESGPYSVDDLMEMGLKPYDLVWVQGRSAAWRYPSEVDELKPIAPIVEEQPYDRFYKKNEETIQPAVVQSAIIQTAVVQSAVVQPAAIQPVQPIRLKEQEEHAIAPEHEKYIPKKSVFVTMPGQKSFRQTPPVKEEKALYQPSTPTPVPVQPTITISENPAAAQIKYSQPLDEIKEMYVKTLHDRKQKIARKSFWFQSLKKAAALLSLVAVGLIAGFVLKSNGSKEQGIVQKEALQKQMNAEPLQGLADTSTPRIQQSNIQIIDPATLDVVDHKDNSRTQEIVEKQQPVELKQPDALKQITEKPAISIPKKDQPLTFEKNEVYTSEVAPGVDIDAATGERTRKVRNGNDRNNNTSSINKNKQEVGDDEELKPRNTVSNAISRMVSVESNEYKKVAFGGIRDLHLTVTNDSKYTLDDVIVELSYLKPSEQPLWTANILFKSIGPNNSSTLRIPDTNRGIKVSYKIIHIKSRQLDEGVAGN